jgi:Arc/MetJ family transcription regulator
MRTTVTLNDDLLAKAKKYTGVEETTAVVNEALKRLVEREAARRLALMGGSEANMPYIIRERSEIE